MATVSVEDINLYYEQSGTGEPLVLIQGLGLDSSAWLHQIPALSQQYQVIRFDNRGIGRSDAPKSAYSTRMMAKDTIALLDALSIDRATVLGFSLGGCIAQILALQYPKRVQRLILINTAAQFPQITLQVIQIWLKLFQAGVDPETQMRAQLPLLFTDAFFEDQQQVNNLIKDSLQHLYPPTIEGFAGQVAACLEHNTTNQLQQIAAPTLILSAQADQLVAPASSYLLALQIPNAKLQRIEGAGHNFFWEKPSLLNQAVLSFLGDCDREH